MTIDINKANSKQQGVGLRILGSIIIFLAIMNLLFFIRGGLSIKNFYIVMLFIGVIMLIAGSWRNRIHSR